MGWDYVIVGAGSAGCVLAERLSANPATRVLLLEAGPDDRHPFIAMPRGAGKLYSDARRTWQFQTEARGDIPSETWIRGKGLGGSSAINGMVYLRGQPEDYDGWEAKGASGWGWREMGEAFREMESHELGGDGKGPLRVTVEPEATPLAEAFIAAGEQLGLPRLADINAPSREGVGYMQRNIWKGRRQSAAQAFLKPARGRPNLEVITGALVERVQFRDGAACGVVARVRGERREIAVDGEVIVAAGGLLSPQILQRSGIGDAGLLRPLGIEVVAHSPGVGEHLLEHRLMICQYEMAPGLGDNHELRGWRLAANVLRYYLTRGGPMAVGYATVGAFARVLPDSPTPDIEFLMAPAVTMFDAAGRMVIDPKPSMQVSGYPLRTLSEGFVRITSADPQAPARIDPGYLSDPRDQAVTVAMHRLLRRWMQQPAIARHVVAERDPVADDEAAILAAYRSRGSAGFHASSTCRMGDFPDAVLDAHCRVRGVRGLRVVDGSTMPTMVSANTNAPIMALAWRAASLITEGRNR